MKNWKAQNIDNAQYIGILEFESNYGEYHNFEIVDTGSHLVFGGACNVGLLESGNFEKDEYLSLDENLQQLLEDLESYYNDGKDSQSEAFSCNECM